MKAKGLFMFKDLQDREKGSFTNQETGEVVEYDACKILVCDELDGSKIKERRFKLSDENASLINDLKSLEPYTKITLEFDVVIYNSNAKIIPISFEVA